MLAITISGKVIDTEMLVNRLSRTRRLLIQLRQTSAWEKNLARNGNALIAAVETDDIKDLRDVLEHFEDYVIGKGSKPSLVQDDRVPATSMAWHGDGSVRAIWLFGREYDLQPALTAAAELLAVLPPLSGTSG